MCGIVAYLGNKSALPVLLSGLHNLEYRGYDSTGIALVSGNQINSCKSKGKIQNLERKVRSLKQDSIWKNAICGIAHTRWATHGIPSEENSHPHFSKDGKIAIVHNGVINNYRELKTALENRGLENFKSSTDTEIFARLIGFHHKGNLLESVQSACLEIDGSFGICCISTDDPNKIVMARRGSPIIIGIGNGEIIIASDPIAIVSYTKQVIYLEDDDVASVDISGKVEILSLKGRSVERDQIKINWLSKVPEKGDFPHFMLKEIYDQPEAVSNSIRGRIDSKNQTAYLAGMKLTSKELSSIKSLKILGCGTSFYSGLLAKYAFEDFAELPTDVRQAADFYDYPLVDKGTFILAVSQSGETADTLNAAREAIQKNLPIAGIVNAEGSTLGREIDRGIYIHAGPEISVASTKAFICQSVTLSMLALKFARIRTMNLNKGRDFIGELEKLPDLIQEVLDNQDGIKKMAKKLSVYENCFLIGRGYFYPVALEAALKIKEISYIHAEGYHSAELKHGPLALLTEKMPVIALANDGGQQEKMILAISECRARKSPVFGTVIKGKKGEQIKEMLNAYIEIPEASPLISAIVSTTALQLLAYHTACIRGCHIDQPRNLAKSVTVE